MIDDTFDRLRPHVLSHGDHALERGHHRCFLASRQQVGEVAHRNAHGCHIGHLGVGFERSGRQRRLDGREWRHIPDHRQGAILRVKGKSDFPLHRHLVDRASLRRLDPCFGNTVSTRLRNNCRIVGIEEEVQLRLIEICLVGNTGGLKDPIRIIEKNTKISDAANTGLRADRRLSHLDTWIAKSALLGFAALPVVIHLLVRAG